LYHSFHYRKSKNYIKEKYGVSIDILEAKLEDLVKTSHLKIMPISITEESQAYEDGIALDLSNKDKDGTYLYCPSGSAQSAFILRMAGLETEDYSSALELLIGKELYIITCSRDVIAIANKETKEICVLNTFYTRGEDDYNIRNVKMLEEKYGIAPNSLDNRIKMLIKNNEESK